MSKREEMFEVMRGIELLSNVSIALLKAVYMRNGTVADIKRLGLPEGRGIIAGMADLITHPPSNGYWIEVRAESLESMITRGQYCWHNDNINEQNFTIEGPHEAEVFLRRFIEEELSTEAVRQRLTREGWRPATLAELLALVARYPSLDLDFRIAALGSIWVSSDTPKVLGNNWVAVLDRYGLGRGLLLEYADPEHSWNDTWSFAVVRVPTAGK